MSRMYTSCGQRIAKLVSDDNNLSKLIFSGVVVGVRQYDTCPPATTNELERIGFIFMGTGGAGRCGFVAKKGPGAVTFAMPDEDASMSIFKMEEKIIDCLRGST